MVVWNSTQSEAFASHSRERHRRACDRLRNCATSILLRNLSHSASQKTPNRTHFRSKPRALSIMSIQFFQHMDEKFVLEIQSYLLPSESEMCVMLWNETFILIRYYEQERFPKIISFNPPFICLQHFLLLEKRCFL